MKYNFIEITKIETVKNKNGIQVNDLTVENDHSYIASNLIVHNCTSSANVSIHYPMATLIDDIINEREKIISYNNLCKDVDKKIKLTKIVADGGIGWYDDINTALALGADAVMIGRCFAECEEACGEWHWAWNENAANNNNWLSTEEKDNIQNMVDSMAE